MLKTLDVYYPISKAGIAQLVERNLAKVEVASSNLVSRSNLIFLTKAEYFFMKKLLYLTFLALLVSSCVSSSILIDDQTEDMSKKGLLCENDKNQSSNLPDKNCLSQEELKQLEEKKRRDLLSEQRRRARMGS